ncbi:MAG: hypothetical protein Q7R99_03360 [bacterium]|nr:hypothetical protein [bacterium]
MATIRIGLSPIASRLYEEAFKKNIPPEQEKEKPRLQKFSILSSAVTVDNIYHRSQIYGLENKKFS